MRAIKIVSIIVLSTLLSQTIYAQNNVGIGTNSPDASAVLDIMSTDKGLLIPRVSLDNAATAAPVTAPIEGLLIYNETGTESHGFWYWDGSQWVQVGAGGSSSCVTLDEAYDCSTPGGGRIVTVNDGAIEYNQTGGTNTEVLKITTNQGTTGSPSAGIYSTNSSAGGGAIYGEITNTSNQYSAIQGWSSSNQANSSGISGGFDGAGAGYGVYGTNISGTAGSQAIFGFNQRTTGGWGVEGAGVNGVYGRTNEDGGFGIVGYNFGPQGGLDVSIAVTGQGSTGVQGETSSGPGYGVYGKNVSSSGTDNNVGVGGYGWVGVLGTTTGGGFGVYASGDLGSSGTKSFVIDHPIDPENKILKHFCAESPEVLNIYRGNIILDDDGNATVNLPYYFKEININFSYQLTAIGTPASGIYVKEEISENSFKIAGGNPNQKISWVVYAERNDLYLQKHPESKKVEIEKRKKGKYISPDLYGKSDDDAYFAPKNQKSLNLKK